jgi:hypothetical protein
MLMSSATFLPNNRKVMAMMGVKVDQKTAG